MKKNQTLFCKIYFLPLILSLAMFLGAEAQPPLYQQINKNPDIHGAAIIRNNLIVGDSNIHESAVAEFRSRNKGVLLPSMTTAQMAAIATPDSGLLIYNSSAKSFYYFNGSTWIDIGGGGANNWSLNGNSGTDSTNYIGTSDGQKIKLNSRSGVWIKTDSAELYIGNDVVQMGTKSVSGIRINTSSSPGVSGSIFFFNLESDGSPFTAMNIDLKDSINKRRTLFEMNADQTEIEVYHDTLAGNIKITPASFNAGSYHNLSQQYLFANWGDKYFTMGNTQNYRATLVGEEAQSKVYAYSRNGFTVKNILNASNLNLSDSITIQLDSVAVLKTNLPAIQLGNAIIYHHADSAAIYATTPIKGATYYCDNCTPIDNSSGGVIISYNGTLWKRYW